MQKNEINFFCKIVNFWTSRTRIHKILTLIIISMFGKKMGKKTFVIIENEWLKLVFGKSGKCLKWECAQTIRASCHTGTSWTALWRIRGKKVTVRGPRSSTVSSEPRRSIALVMDWWNLACRMSADNCCCAIRL